MSSKSIGRAMSANRQARSEALRGRVSSAGADLITAERQRQIDAEDWTPEHDDAHDSGELVHAAISYAYSPFSDVRQAPDDDYRKPAGTAAPSTWPWEDEWWKPTPKDRVRELTKAGALIAAEIDRLQRAES